MGDKAAAHPDDLVLISRDNADAKPRRRVFVTGPHFGRDIYSSVETRNEAVSESSEGLFKRSEAERLIAAGKWRGRRPEIVEL
jgi:hypothetical protein